MTTFDEESRSYQQEVDEEAARIVREGEAAPWEAIPRAHLRVQRRRMEKARQRRGPVGAATGGE